MCPRGVERNSTHSDRLPSHPVRIAFAGTAEFAVPSLRACNARHQVVAAVTQPARPGSRGRPAPRPVADAAVQLGIPVLQPERIRSGPVVEEILGLEADVLVVAAYGQIVPRTLLDGHRFGGVNVHASLLPRWRGAAPIARAILAGDAVTGVCIMRMEAGLDTGPVYARREVPIDAGGHHHWSHRDPRHRRSRGVGGRAGRPGAGNSGSDPAARGGDDAMRPGSRARTGCSTGKPAPRRRWTGWSGPSTRGQG